MTTMKPMMLFAPALMLAAGPAYAAPAANPAAPLSVTAAARATSGGQRAERLAGPGAIVGLVLAAAVIAGGVYIVADDDDSDSN